MRRYAVLSMDVEDWYHLDYFLNEDCDRKQTTIDGLEYYLNFLKSKKIKSTFFVVIELVEKHETLIKRIIKEGHEIALHSYSHKRPLTISVDEFYNETLKSISIIKEKFNYDVKGFRAPCFSFDRERLEVLRKLGLVYDSSMIQFPSHSLYGTMDIADFEHHENIHLNKTFIEFEATTVKIGNKILPIAGGGYIRIFPWIVIKFFLNKLMNFGSHYFFYIHPFELSSNYSVKLPSNTPFITRVRFALGRKTVRRKINLLFKFLEQNKFEFVRFQDLIENEKLIQINNH